MEQYIKKSSLVAEIKTRIETYNKGYANGDDCRADALETFLHDIDTLEVKEVGVDLGDPKGDKSTKYIIDTKTLEVKEVDLEKEVADYIEQHNSELSGYFDIRRIARHFFALGLNSQTKDMQEALRMEYEKGRADVLRCIDPDVMVADFCSQPLSKTRSLASIYRQGIIDLLKKINNNEETSITSTRSIDDVGL